MRLPSRTSTHTTCSSSWDKKSETRPSRALELPNCQYWALAHKVVALAHLDRPMAMAKARQALLAAKPEFSVSFARHKLFYLKRED